MSATVSKVSDSYTAELVGNQVSVQTEGFLLYMISKEERIINKFGSQMCHGYDFRSPGSQPVKV